MQPQAVALYTLQSEAKCFLGYLLPTLVYVEDKVDQYSEGHEVC